MTLLTRGSVGCLQGFGSTVNAGMQHIRNIWQAHIWGSNPDWCPNLCI